MTSLFQLATARTSAVGLNATREIESEGGSGISMSLILVEAGAVAALLGPALKKDMAAVLR